MNIRRSTKAAKKNPIHAVVYSLLAGIFPNSSVVANSPNAMSNMPINGSKAVSVYYP